MLAYIIRRLILAIPILFGVALISFLLVYLSPGDPLARFFAPNIRPETVERLREIYGLDKPLPEQFVGWIT
ncbi:MAG TPA: ABC transporter permease, partial [Candidatus Limnocylindria bacterium]|nr:ABC transporter permease [Candidatus Limnocylindria bacterium]